MDTLKKIFKLSLFVYAVSALRVNAQNTEIDKMIKKNRMGILIVKAEAGSQVKVEQIRHDFWFGAAISSSIFSSWQNDKTKNKYKKVFLENFNSAVTENALKWHSMERQKGKVNYAVVDAMLKWTEKHDIPLRGHNVYWGISGRVQPWIKKSNDDELRKILKNRAVTIADRYKGLFAEYDLNNEMIHGNYYADRLGENITKEMVTWFKGIDPEAKLYLNDYDILTGRRLDDYIRHINGFLKNKVAIDGIGVQGHLHGDSFDPAVLRSSLDKLAKTGLPICITEFNFPGQRSKVYRRRDLKLTPDQEQAKAKALTEYYTICFSHPAVKGILMWGFWEGANWIPQSSLYKRDWTPTLALKAYQDLVFKKWWTKWEGTADKDGYCRIPAFYGKYRVTSNGKEKVLVLKRPLK